MKTIYLIALVAVMFAAGCSRDKGNYDYTPIDEIAIEGIDSDYIGEFNSRFSITVTLSHTLETDLNDLEFQWEINGTVVSEEKDLDIELQEGVKFGKNQCRYTVIDKRTGMKYFKRFILNVVSSFNWGYYFLTEASDHSTILSYLQATSDEEERKNMEFLHTTGIGEYSFGENPRTISGFFGYVVALSGEFWTINIMTHDGEYPVIQTENSTFMPNLLVNSGSFADQTAGYTFNPDDILIHPNDDIFFINDGRVISYQSGIMYRPSQHDADYYWSHPVLAATYTTIFVFDRNTEMYYAIKPQPDDPEHGIVGDSYAYDKVMEITFPGVTAAPDFHGHRILGAYTDLNEVDDDYVDIIHVASADSEGFHITDMNITYYGETSIQRDTPRQTFANVTGIDDNSQALIINMDWYVSAGNTIYTSPQLSPTFTRFVELPASLGTITHMRPSARGKALVVTTYNPSSAAEKKGSVILIDLNTTRDMLVYENVIDRCVSLFSANTHPRGGEIGDEK